MMIEEFLKRIEEVGFTVTKSPENQLLIGLDCCPQWRIFLYDIDDEKLFPVFYYRQKRIEEVTDLHAIVPTVLTAITKSRGISSFRFLGEHNDFSGIEDELYGMYWFPAQPLNERIRKNSKRDFESFFRILMELYMFHMYQGNILGAVGYCPDDFSFDSPELNIWKNKIRGFIGEDESYVANFRMNPDWLFFRSFSSEFSIFKSTHIAGLLKQLAINNDNSEIINGVVSNVEVINEIRTTIPFKDEKYAKNLVAALGDTSKIEVISQENQLVFISDHHVVIKYSNCGLESVSEEKELIRLRQLKEISLLFGDQKFEWNIIDRQASGEFEDLVLELLNREPWVFSVRKVAPTNQGDNGRDLICEYNMLHNENRVSRGTESVQLGKMIVQCKTNLKHSKKSSISKSDVDMANTIFDYRPDGYMLVVNTQITRDLTEMLERQRDRKEQNTIVWWNAFDVEDRLRKNPDILARYRHLVNYA
ncbi:hypothetical protein NO989_20070 [Alteromonas sp. DY56-G5]|jgi:hypothetical protein|uniref:hypothetical protein n=1 Tax=Alteromonas sp. DY56-G5 TaxID=2967128 RepID=UPI00352BC039|tara:strand:+ start:1573 stop:3003 length:1431 start_codon:yes stop_codon:yes gene_type:complete